MGSWVHDKVHVKSLDFFEPCAKAAKNNIVLEMKHAQTMTSQLAGTHMALPERIVLLQFFQW